MTSHWLAVMAGGAVGAVLRAGVYELFALTEKPYLHVYPTLIVNLAGSFIIGISAYLLIEKGVFTAEWKAFLMPGFLGALTTFSTFSLDVFRLLQHSTIMLAIFYSLGSVIFCVVATYFGYIIARWLLP